MKNVFVNSGGREKNTYDAIVIGSGMTGGWAAKELCEKGLRTLVLERGRNVEHIKDYTTATKAPWEFPHRLALTSTLRNENPILSRCYAFDESTEHFFVKDHEHPYIQTKPFDWIRGYQVGGKSLLWARWTQRWSDLDFEANAQDGIGVDWPIRYKDIAPWYSYVEKFVGISGNRDGLPQVPDGEFLPPMEMNCIEKHLKQSVESHFPNRNVIISRTANLTRELNGRGPCQYRDLCNRGCPYGAYFSSNSATLPAANATGNMTLQPFAVVHSILYDEQKRRASGVRVINATTNEVTEYFADLIFVNSGTLNSTLILLNSISNRFPNGLGNDSQVLGHYLMDHNYRGRVSGEHAGFQDQYFFGRRPTGIYIPRFRNLWKEKQKEFLRGYAYAGFGSRQAAYSDAIGKQLKEQYSTPGNWSVSLVGMGECLPYKQNKITLSKDKTDQWGIPLLDIDCTYQANEETMLTDLLNRGAEMLDTAGFTNINKIDTQQAMGLAIHEMGTARMGKDPASSILNKYNQVWDVKNVFVTDGACMTSGACQNPSLTYMAITARAVDYAVGELKRLNL